MTTVLAICVAVLVTVSVYLMLSHELKSVAMGVFALGHGANLSIIAMSGSPVLADGGLRNPPILGVADLVDPLPQALILTAIVINFAVAVTIPRVAFWPFSWSSSRWSWRGILLL